MGEVSSMGKDKSLDDVRHRFEWDAKNFDSIYRLEKSPVSRAFNRVFRKAVFQRYDITFDRAGDVKGKSILDIGCGSGLYSADFARRGASRVLGIDFSSNMLELARKEARNHNVEDKCEFRQENFLEAKFDEKFDVTFAMGVFDYLPDPIPFLKKMVSVTKGRIIVSIPGHSIVRERLRKLRYIFSGRGHVHFYDEGEVQELIKAADFKSHEIVYMRSSGTGYILIGDVKS